MTASLAVPDPAALLETLCAEPHETEWLEFKVNAFVAEEAGKYVAALANSAMLTNQSHGYLVFGVQDVTHNIVGTTVKLRDEKVGNEPFENWLCRWLTPRLNLKIIEFSYRGHDVVIIKIDPAYQKPVTFKNEAYIRIGSALKPLRDYEERERSLWHLTSKYSFEQGIALGHQSAEEIIDRFDCRNFFSLLSKKAASTDDVINQLLLQELIIDDKQRRFDITNLFALLAARDLKDFPYLREKAPRVIVYKTNTKMEAIADTFGHLGYASSLPRVLRYLLDRIPQHEEMRHGIRHKEFMYPQDAVREFLANAFIHQDFTAQGGGPVIELFSDRLVITNPGIPLIPTDRFIDAPSKSRNRRLAEMMRHLRLCELRGSGVDRALIEIEKRILPPPLFEQAPDSTVVTLLKERSFSGMTKEERIRACYQHACLRHQSGDYMSNGSLRRRFGLEDKQYPQASLVIGDTLVLGLISPLADDQGNRNARYVPAWAKAK